MGIPSIAIENGDLTTHQHMRSLQGIAHAGRERPKKMIEKI